MPRLPQTGSLLRVQLTRFCVTVSVILTGPKGGIVPVWQVPGPFPYQQASLCLVLIKVLSVII